MDVHTPHAGILNPAQTFLALLRKFREVSVHFDADNLNTVVPDGYKGLMCLTYGLNLPVPIVDLFVTRIGVRATLSFNRSPFKTFISWDSVVMFTVKDPNDGVEGYEQRGARFPSDAPATGTDGAAAGEIVCVLPPHGDDVEHMCMPYLAAANSVGLRSIRADDVPPEGLEAPRAVGRPELWVVR